MITVAVVAVCACQRAPASAAVSLTELVSRRSHILYVAPYFTSQ